MGKRNRMKNNKAGISFFQRYLSVWVLICMGAGILIGHFLPVVPAALSHLQVAGISIPIAVLIWVMIYPMMLKVDFQSIREVGKNPKGLVVTWIVNWLIKPFSMYAIAYFFLFVVFRPVIAPHLASQYLAGAVLLGAAPCTAMVFVWSTLTKGNPAYTVVQVATNYSGGVRSNREVPARCIACAGSVQHTVPERIPIRGDSTCGRSADACRSGPQKRELIF